MIYTAQARDDVLILTIGHGVFISALHLLGHYVF